MPLSSRCSHCHCEQSEAIKRVGLPRIVGILCLLIAALAPLARNDVGILHIYFRVNCERIAEKHMQMEVRNQGRTFEYFCIILKPLATEEFRVMRIVRHPTYPT